MPGATPLVSGAGRRTGAAAFRADVRVVFRFREDFGRFIRFG
jgi:hypothetical protein